MIRKSHGWFALIIAVIVGMESNAMMAGNLWGSGYYGGMPYCPGGVQYGKNALSASDEMIEIREEQEEVAREIRDRKKELAQLRRELRESERDLRRYLRSEAVSDIKTHVVSSKQCREWTGRDGEHVMGPGAKTENETEKVETAAPIGSRSETTVDNRVSPEALSGFTAADWRRACPIQGGNRQMNARNVCEITSGVVITSPKALHPSDKQSCTTGVDRYQTAVSRQAQLAEEINQLEAYRKRLREEYRVASRDFKRDLKDGVYDEDTEGTVCIDCDFKRRQAYEVKPNWAQVITGVLGGGLVIAAGARQTKMIASYNAAQGYPTENNYAAYLPAGIGMMMNGLAGAMGGGTGHGAFACNGGIYGGMYNPLWGYPPGMMAGAHLGGGMFIPGMSPWGYNGYPYGMGGPMMGGFGMGGPMMGGFGMGGPMMGGMFPGMGAPGLGFANFGIGAGGMGGFGMGGPMMGGPMMGGFGMGGPMMGGPMMGGFGMGGPMMGGPMMGGFGMGGPMMGGPMMGGFGMGGPMMGGPMMGGPMMGGGFDALGQLRMQQQMLQYQMQAQQMYMQQVNQQLQNQQRLAMQEQNLMAELNSVAMRLQQVRMGYYMGGSVGVGIGGGGSIGIGAPPPMGIGGSVGIGGGVYYNGSYMQNPYNPYGPHPQNPYAPGGNTGCVGLSCSPTNSGVNNNLSPSR